MVSFIPGLSLGEKMEGSIEKSAPINIPHIIPERIMKTLYFIMLLFWVMLGNYLILKCIGLENFANTFLFYDNDTSVLGK